MVFFIEDIIARFGGRYYGSRQEKDAQYYTAKILKKFSDKTEVQPFRSPLHAHFKSLRLFCTVYVVSLVLFKVNIYAAAVVGMLNTIFFMGHFVTYRHWLDFLFPKQTSYNVVADIEPLGMATSTIIVAGHMDSVKEFKWWYKLKHTGVVLSVIAGFLIPFLGLFCLAASFFQPSVITDIIWWFFVLATPVLIVYFDMHGDIVVDGALDNLTGVALAVEMAKVFSNTRLNNTRVRIISFGAEEAGLRGSWAYAKANRQKLLDENALLLNLDTIKEKSELTVVTGELNTLVFFKNDLVERLEESFRFNNTAYKKILLNVGATDASAFHILGLPALAVIGMASEKLDPCYHTRLDNTQNLKPEGLLALREVLIHFIEEWDKNPK